MMIRLTEYRDMLDETMPPVRFGNLEYGYGTALERIDHPALVEAYWAYVFAMDEETEHEAEHV